MKLAPTKTLFGVEVVMRLGQRITAESIALGCGEIEALLHMPMNTSALADRSSELLPENDRRNETAEFATEKGCSS